MRIEDGGYLKEYPIRFNCMNCRALIKGTHNISMPGQKVVNSLMLKSRTVMLIVQHISCVMQLM